MEIKKDSRSGCSMFQIFVLGTTLVFLNVKSLDVVMHDLIRIETTGVGKIELRYKDGFLYQIWRALSIVDDVAATIRL